jgi:hypothetical protein
MGISLLDTMWFSLQVGRPIVIRLVALGTLNWPELPSPTLCSYDYARAGPQLDLRGWFPPNNTQ